MIKTKKTPSISSSPFTSCSFGGTSRRLFVLLLCTALTALSAANDLSFLMVGNSFTNENNLQEMIKTMLENDLAMSHHQPVYAMRFRKPASRFAEDVLDPALRTTISERAWTWVVLQEQSQIPAFWDTRFQATFDLSVNAAQQMNQWIANNTLSETILLMTWGRRTADWAWYPDMFPDFMTMQTKVTAGYEKIQDVVSTPQRPVRIAPAGLAFEHIFKSIPGNASADGTDFTRLYEQDGTHPSVEGSYLVACVVYATMTGHDPRALASSTGPAQIPQARREALQQVAYDTVEAYNQANKWNQQYWQMHPDTHDHGSGNTNNDNSKPYPPPNDDSSSPSRPYVPKEKRQQKHNGKAKKTFAFGRWLLWGSVLGAVLAVWYTRQQRQRTTRRAKPSLVERGGAYTDISTDVELTDVGTEL